MIRFPVCAALVTMCVTLLIISALVFFIIKLPPGDFLTNQIAELRAQGEAASVAKAEFLIKQYGLDRPVWEQYLVWIGVMPGPNGFSGLLQGDWGWSFEYDKPVSRSGRRRPVADAARQSRGGDLHPPRVDPDRDLFGDAAIFARRLHRDLHRLYRPRDPELPARADPALLRRTAGSASRSAGSTIRNMPASPGRWPKIQSLLSHLVVPTVVIGLGGTAAMIRRMRANLLDELGKQYYVTAKAKGLAGPQGAAEISVPHVAQPVHRRYRQPAAAPRLGLGAGVARAEPADRRADPARAP